tara:strand:- start:187 stop:324 length:138 start_codon:yes stop_codon:yes gene_type:complete
MTRILLQYVLPLLLPAAIFLVWVMLTRKRAGSKARGSGLSSVASR